MRALALAVLLTAGCPRPVRGPERALDVPTCPASVAPRSADVCDGWFTAEGLACVRCEGVRGCVDKADQVYCADGECPQDPRCRLEPANAAW